MYVEHQKPPIPAGYEQVWAGTYTAVGLTIPTDARYAIFKTASGAGRYRDDGTPPTSMSGYLLAVNDIVTLTSAEQLVGFEVICTTADTMILEVLYYKIRA
jgi:hypothetical protein